jgi:hypothetical protein
LTVLWNALFPPAVLIAILNDEATPSLHQGNQEIKRGLTAEAAVNLGCISKLGISTSYIRTAQANAGPWCIAWPVKDYAIVDQSQLM